MNQIFTFIMRWKIKRLIAARDHLEEQLIIHRWAIADISAEIRRLEFAELATRIDAK